MSAACRRQLFERLERAPLRPLPSTPYGYADWHKKTLNTDHVEVEKHWHSAPVVDPVFGRSRGGSLTP